MEEDNNRHDDDGHRHQSVVSADGHTLDDCQTRRRRCRVDALAQPEAMNRRHHLSVSLYTEFSWTVIINVTPASATSADQLLPLISAASPPSCTGESSSSLLSSPIASSVGCVPHLPSLGDELPHWTRRIITGHSSVFV